MIARRLFTPVDISPLVIFRICFGLLISFECFGALITGWVTRVLVAPEFTFSFIGFEWIQPLPGPGMYFYFVLMGCLGLCIALGWRYRLSVVLFTLLWAGVYLMQKTAYNNHYYLLILISFMMIWFPANRFYAMDVNHGRTQVQDTMPAYVKWFFVFQLWIVYTYAAIAKLYGGWMDLSFIELLMQPKASYYIIGEWLQRPIAHKAIAGFGIVFDFLVIPALLWKRTRWLAFGLGIFFHLFNSFVFQIGIFPYLSLAFTLFFFEAEKIRKLFFKGKTVSNPAPPRSRASKGFLIFWTLYFIIQLALPLRHYFIEDKVLWTEEGHRHSWRMMLRSRRGTINFRVVDKANGKVLFLKVKDSVSAGQMRKLQAYPDYIWQFAQRIKTQQASMGKDVAVYANCKVRINQGNYHPFIDPKVDLASEQWDYFKHHSWILPSPEELK